MVAPVVAAGGIGAISDLAGGLANEYFAEKRADKDWKRQKKVLQNQVQWRVADAVQAGLHPLAALGLNPASGPVAGSVGDIGSALSSMGQNIGRAAEAFLRPEDKIAAKSALLGLEQQQANIDLTRAQLAGAQKALLTQGSTPGVASPIPMNGPHSVPDPFTGEPLEVAYPGLAQTVENDFAEIISNVYGVGNYARSVWNGFQKSGGVGQYLPGGSGAEALWRYFNP